MEKLSMTMKYVAVSFAAMTFDHYLDIHKITPFVSPPFIHPTSTWIVVETVPLFFFVLETCAFDSLRNLLYLPSPVKKSSRNVIIGCAKAAFQWG
jgi:hypothetical protein